MTGPHEREGRIQLACLDLAGTTIGDQGLVDQAFEAALEAAGVGPTDPRRPRMAEHVARTMGASKIEVFRALFADEDRARTANRAFEEAYEALVGSGAVRPLPGAAEAIERLRSAGVRVALVTGFSVATRQRLLEAIEWQNIADLALSPADAGRGRPAPDLVLTALLRLGVDAVWSVAVAGDTEADMECGRRAGAGVVAGVLTGAGTRDRLTAAGATHVLDSVGQLPALLGID